ncbi:MAG: type IV pilus modification protein PilV [Aquipseudomonas alcaligenes]|uniref:Type IV pilus modification protein PilV n=1 Tax=Aquipseudomonas alcaligenes TaxID=43263 RepID=A0A5C7WC66_AQUAC|nr:MAG: type IV pilus modification protein PilV [Pseudomonas alcaligenes]
MSKEMSSRSSGFTLIEVMVALVVLAVGLLGMASLMVRSQQSNEGAYSRSQASILAYDIVERMRSNKVLANPLETRKVSYATQNDAYALTALPTCATPATGQQVAGSAQATQDVAQWCQLVKSSLPNVDTANTSIVRTAGTNLYTVTIQWQDATADGDSTQNIQVVAEL